MIAPDTSHLVALHIRLSHERERLAMARNERERALRAVYVAQCEREIAGEFTFFGMEAPADSGLSVDDLARELGI